MTDFLVRRFVKDYEKTDNADVRTSYGILSSIVGICCNILLFAAKLLVGVGMHSLAIMADAFTNRPTKSIRSGMGGSSILQR